ncbi:hypothetical protein ACFVYJ_11800, partial [Pontibacter sp. JAM-7]|uniref:hypothetical protein n=1 Tax=Pontibacter sp. JAM-7 TaxID=3366581 RepID=UPI003AF6B740
SAVDGITGDPLGTATGLVGDLPLVGGIADTATGLAGETLNSTTNLVGDLTDNAATLLGDTLGSVDSLLAEDGMLGDGELTIIPDATETLSPVTGLSEGLTDSLPLGALPVDLSLVDGIIGTATGLTDGAGTATDLVGGSLGTATGLLGSL